MGVTKTQKMRLGIFVACGLLLLVGGLIALAGARLGEERDYYTIRYTEGGISLSGLDVGSPVKYSGIRVGRVERIGIDPNDLSVIEVQISLQEGTPVAGDSVANLGSMGITGLKYIELSRGTASAAKRKPGEDIPAGSSGIDDLTNRAGEIAEKVSTTLDRVNALVAPEMKDRVAGVLDRTNKLLETVEATVAENRETLKSLGGRADRIAAELEGLTAELAGSARRVNRLLERISPSIDKTLGASARLLDELRETRKTLDRALASADGFLKQGTTTLSGVDPLIDRTNLLLAQSRENLVEALAYLRETAENLSDFSRRVREDPSLLLIGEGDDEEAN
ncbi:MAG: MCE family protein [Myxococcales bacterium]|nr:MCE family protein [Myxococcales bacterium]